MKPSTKLFADGDKADRFYFIVAGDELPLIGEEALEEGHFFQLGGVDGHGLSVAADPGASEKSSASALGSRGFCGAKRSLASAARRNQAACKAKSEKPKNAAGPARRLRA